MSLTSRTTSWKRRVGEAFRKRNGAVVAHRSDLSEERKHFEGTPAAQGDPVGGKWIYVLTKMYSIDWMDREM
jgi:hypothetical protein